MVGCLTGDTSGVASKGVEACVFLMFSKFDKPDDGLVSGDDKSVVVKFNVSSSNGDESRFGLIAVGFDEKCPKLSL